MAGALGDEVAIVTGAGINTGAIIAKTLAREGAAVIVNYRNAEQGPQRLLARSPQLAGGRLPYRAT
jgi:3-oxoacyl-[acyl-carrier protein] reductase